MPGQPMDDRYIPNPDPTPALNSESPAASQFFACQERRTTGTQCPARQGDPHSIHRPAEANAITDADARMVSVLRRVASDVP